jgi:drug/metabolite transporter (DMT)-like permease
MRDGLFLCHKINSYQLIAEVQPALYTLTKARHKAVLFSFYIKEMICLPIKRHWANLSLLAITLVWGATFVVVKRSTEDLAVFPFLGIRFAIAFLTLLPFVWTQRVYITRLGLLRGLGLGSILFLGYATQTVGLQYTTASNAGFITGLSVVLVPLLVAITTQKLPRPSSVVGIVSATLGLALLSLGDKFTLNSGDLLVLMCAVFFALHIFFVGRFAPSENPTILAAGQILAVSLLSGLFSFFSPHETQNFTSYAWFGILLTAIPATSIAFVVQMKMQQFTTSTHTALIFSAEPVFSALFAFFLAGEILTPQGLAGAALVLSGMLFAEFSGAERSKEAPSETVSSEEVSIEEVSIEEVSIEEVSSEDVPSK